jgi:hypothetical protein
MFRPPAVGNFGARGRARTANVSCTEIDREVSDD